MALPLIDLQAFDYLNKKYGLLLTDYLALDTTVMCNLNQSVKEVIDADLLAAEELAEKVISKPYVSPFGVPETEFKKEVASKPASTRKDKTYYTYNNLHYSPFTRNY